MPLFLILVVSTSAIVYYMSYRHVTELQKLEIVQNSAARLAFEESKFEFCYVTPLLKSLHWLIVKCRTFKAIHGLAPPYVSELISVRDCSLNYGVLVNF